MSDIENIAAQINNLKRGNKKFISNAYFSKLQLEEKINAENYTIYSNDDFISLLEDNISFSRLYFYLRSYDSIAPLIRYLKTTDINTITADIVGKNPSAQNLADALCQQGFGPYADYSRWQTSSTNRLLYNRINDVNIDFAEDNDAAEILEILRKQFDPITSYLPDINRVHLGIKSNEIFIIKKNHLISALIWVENNGIKSKYIYQLVVRDEFKSIGYGLYLYEFVFNLYEANTVYTSWSDDKNDAINNMHRFYGFKKDGLVDHILRLKSKKGE
jgi:hypothetical protein